jgi:hypothetical protein
MKIERTYLVEKSEIIDLDTNEGVDHFVGTVVQDHVQAAEFIARLKYGEVITVNSDEPRYEETYEVVP